MSSPGAGRRASLDRRSQRYNWLIALVAIIVLILLVVVSRQLLTAVLVAAFLFGLGQMAIGIYRRREYLRRLEAEARAPDPPETPV